MLRKTLPGLFLAGLLCLGPGASDALAGDAVFTSTAGTFAVKVTSLRESLFKSVVRQQYDFSCGSAALATLLTYHYDHPVSEDDVFNAMFAAGDQPTIQKFGFSMADMQRYLATLGYRSDGYQVPLDTVAEAGVPAIALINAKGYNHFVVIKGIKDGDVLVGDPAGGLKSVPQGEFAAMSQGTIFVIRDDPAAARQHFNRSDEWMVRRKAPFGTAVNRQALSSYLAMLPGLHQF